MPEAFAVLRVFGVSVFVYIFAWVRARDPANYRHAEEVERLRIRGAWLEERLRLSERENWSAEMRADLTAQLADNARDLAKAEEAVP